MHAALKDRLTKALERPHRLGMIGGELEEQLAHCASFSRVLGQVDPDGEWTRGADLGTGGGIPGLVLAAALPHIDWMLIEIRTSRATEVERALLSLGINSTVRTEHGQLLGHEDGLREQFDVVVARAFGPSTMTAECASGLLRVGGSLVVSEPPTEIEDRWPIPGLAAFGLGTPKMTDHNGHRFAIIEKCAPLAPGLPRLPAKPKRPWPSKS